MERYRAVAAARAKQNTELGLELEEAKQAVKAAERKLKQAGPRYQVEARLEKRPIEDTAAARRPLPSVRRRPRIESPSPSRRAQGHQTGRPRRSTDRGRAVSTTLTGSPHAAGRRSRRPTGLQVERLSAPLEYPLIAMIVEAQTTAAAGHVHHLLTQQPDGSGDHRR